MFKPSSRAWKACFVALATVFAAATIAPTKASADQREREQRIQAREERIQAREERQKARLQREQTREQKE
jgi:hypothetical protein